MRAERHPDRTTSASITQSPTARDTSSAARGPLGIATPTNAVPCGSTFKGNAVINHPHILAEIARQNRAEMIAAAGEFRRAKQSRRLRKPSRKLRWPVARAEGVPSQPGPRQRPHQAELEGHGGPEASKFAHEQMPQVDGLGRGAKVEPMKLRTERPRHCTEIRVATVSLVTGAGRTTTSQARTSPHR
jgi:hypothetical protein